MLRGLANGLAVVVAVAVAGALVRGILDLTVGTIALAGAGGWLIGTAVRMGAWGGLAHRASGRPAVMAMILGGTCWLLSLVGAWLVAMATLPGSSRTFPDRLAATPFLDWLAPQLVPADYLDLVLFVGLAWIGARSPSTPTGVQRA
jgi:hypothetical protein